jgi:hypothetical protein
VGTYCAASCCTALSFSSRRACLRDTLCFRRCRRLERVRRGGDTSACTSILMTTRGTWLRSRHATMGRWTRRRRTAVVLGALLVCTTHGAATAGPDELGLEHAATAPGLMRRLMGRAFGGHEPYGMPHVNLHIDLSKVGVLGISLGGEGVWAGPGEAGTRAAVSVVLWHRMPGPPLGRVTCW